MNTSSLRGRVGGTAAVAVVLAVGSAALGQELYLLDASHAILTRIDGPTGDVLEELPIVGATQMRRALTARWDGVLYTYDRQLGETRLLRIDPHTGQAEALDGILADSMWTIAADPSTGVLYGTDQNSDLYRIDHTTGEGTLIGKVEDPDLFITPMAMAIGRDGLGYVTDMYPPITLCSVDLSTAETTFICELGSMYWYEDMEFDDGGVLWTLFEYDGSIRRADIANCTSEKLYEGKYAEGLAVVAGGPECYPDCDANDSLDLFDFLCFINGFNAGDDGAECNGDGKFDLFDFLCFVNSFNAGC